jgi:cytochrome c oxidase assembly factor CtaG
MALLAVMFFASANVIYGYYDRPDPLWNLDPMDDQQIAGLIMGGLGELASFVAITWLFFRFLDQEEQPAAPPVRPADAGPTT